MMNATRTKKTRAPVNSPDQVRIDAQSIVRAHAILDRPRQQATDDAQPYGQHRSYRQHIEQGSHERVDVHYFPRKNRNTSAVTQATRHGTPIPSSITAV